MSLPDGYYLDPLENVEPDGPSWCAVETVMMNGDIGADPEDGTISVLIRNEQHQPVAAAWYSEHKNEFSFNIAVSEVCQGQGLGRLMLDKVLLDYGEQKQHNTALTMQVGVINPRLVDDLFRRGFYITMDQRHDPDDCIVLMTEAPPLRHFLDKALKQDSERFFSALHQAAEIAEVDLDEWVRVISQWMDDPSAPLHTEAAEAMCLALPLETAEKEFFWQQLHREQGALSLYPEPSPTNYMLNAPSDEPSLEAPPVENKPCRPSIGARA